MNILLTGSGGFIGQHLKEHLKDKYNLLTPRSWELNLLNESDVDEYFNNHHIDMIIHLAAAGVRITPDATNEMVAKPNIEMFDNLAKYVSKKCKMIVLGSGAEYDKSKPIVNIQEKEFGNSIPQDPYGYSKYLISKKIETQENILNLRVFGVYGVGEDFSRVTTSIIKNNLKDEAISLNQNVKFSFIYIKDLCFIIKFFIDNFPNQKFINVASNIKIEILELAKIINRLGSKKSEILFKESGMNKEYTCDVSLLLSYLPNFPFTSYEEGLMELMSFLKGKK